MPSYDFFLFRMVQFGGGHQRLIGPGENLTDSIFHFLIVWKFRFQVLQPDSQK